MEKINQAKKYLEELGVDGWLLYDFHGNNELSRQFLNISPKTKTTRRFFYWIPVHGEPIKLVHAIESHVLDSWPGEKRLFLSWQSLEEQLRKILKSSRKVAMEYSPMNAIPYVSKLDAGTADLIRSFGLEIVSSAPFLPHFTAVLTDAQAESHVRASRKLDAIIRETWSWIELGVGEWEIQQKIVKAFASENLVTDSPPIVAINAHSADPHFETKKERQSFLKTGDFLLVDFWAKEENGVFADLTYAAVVGKKPTPRQEEIFSIVRDAQRAAIDLVKERMKSQKRIEGWEVDEAARNLIRKAGYEKYFIHRTGHNIGTSLHGSGANMDNLEMHDTRPILKGTCFSIEPGIYLPGEFGVRLECDLLVDRLGLVSVSGTLQDSLFLL